MNFRLPRCNRKKHTKVFSEVLFYKFFFLAANLKLIQKGFATGHFGYNSNTYFPSLFSVLNPFYLNLLLIIFVIAPNRILNAFAAILAWVLMAHPNTLGVQHFVTVFWTSLWLAQHDRSKQSLWIGKFICSMIFLCASLGKATEGWWSGDYIKNLMWTHTHLYKLLGPSLFSKLAIVGEASLGITFLIPGIFGPILSLLLISGMFIAMSLEVLDALGPICGMLLSILAYEISSKTDALSVFNEGISKRTAQIITAWTTNIRISDYYYSTENLKMNKGLSVKNENGKHFHGLDAYLELIRRVPILLPLYPLLKIKIIYRIGEKFFSI
ncbi:hypothetical protein EZJ49_11995 [Bdellovibrio bacteriovorus]|uniref:hypothetical protein n=1 Tax=Bdellovibrio bacteriovorus TaxID=959 RepID=UPI0021D037D6|nr:hypothetical protein [Bdellovibrio bacteriovorus]UXR63786.1 hypothetical protein EZJ49_11995 [Bdellovibrio bacteriovorus]